MGRPAAISVARESAQLEAVAATGATPASQSVFAGVPALVIAADGAVKFSNALSAVFVDRGELKPAVAMHVANALAEGRVQLARVTLTEDGQSRRFDLTLMPSIDGEVVIVAKETSFEANLVAALTASRELFRDLAACNVDFAFETDECGVFSWVSPHGLLGYSPGEMHGARPESLFGSVAGVEYFAATERVDNLEVWLHAKDGSTHCLVVNALSIVGAGNVRRATRGVARDVTDLRAHERKEWRAKRRDDLAATIVEAMRGEIDPSRMLNTAAAALKTATKADAVSIVCNAAKLNAHAGAAVEDTMLKLQANAIYHGSYNGAITLLRRQGSDAFGEEERQLLAAVMPQLGVAIALGETLTERRTPAPERLEVPSC